MGKIRVVHVRGDEYAAMEVEDVIGVENAFYAAFNSRHEWFGVSSNGIYCELRALVYDDSARELAEYIKDNLCDDDTLKSENIFILD